MDAEEVIIVALDASKEITDCALEWAVCNVITKPMYSLIILAVLPCYGDAPTSANKSSNFLSYLVRKWILGDRQKEKNSSVNKDFKRKTVQQDQINNVCVEMMQLLCSEHNKQVFIQVRVVADAKLGSVATAAKELEATWVILDRRLKNESNCCLKQLSCNIVIIDNAVPKILRAVNPLPGKIPDLGSGQNDQNKLEMLLSSNRNDKRAKTRSSLGIESTIFDSDPSISLSSPPKEPSDKTSTRSTINSKSDAPFLSLNSNYFHEEDEVKLTFSPLPSYGKFDKVSSFCIGDSPRKSSASLLDGKVKSYSGLLKTKGDMENFRRVKATQLVSVPARRSADSPRLFQKSERLNQFAYRKYSISSLGEEKPAFLTSTAIQRTSSIRKAMSLSIKHPPTPPPLCSICKHNAPIFGKAPRKFTYREIEKSTDGFSSENLLADGGYGLVYRGVLDDGQVVAVKQHKKLSAQGAAEFCSEVEILSCAQHRNLVILIGYCIEVEWLLIYEFACNGSLDKHLYGNDTNEVMAWNNRMKVAVGAARGLRYLHEDCRVGCIVHRDFRPSNILLTHDFEPMVGDFGLARWQADGQSAEETRVIGAFGYLAPEYTQSGLVTEKTDVYAFGVVLLELLSGIKATDFSRVTGLQFVQEWGCPLLKRRMINEIIDNRLKQNFVENEVHYMMYAASLCISLNPENRPRMSKILKILEGDISADMTGHQAANYPKQYVNQIYGTDSIMTSPPDHMRSSTLLQSVHDLSPSPPGTSVDRNNGMNSTVKTLAPFKEYKTARGRGSIESKQYAAIISREYQAHLQGSLTKFVNNFNEH